MSFGLDRHIMTHFTQLPRSFYLYIIVTPLYHMSPLVSYPLSFPCHFTYNIAFAFPMVFYMSLYERQAHLSFISPIGSDPNILVLRCYLVSGGFMTISVFEVTSSTWLCIFILFIDDLSIYKKKKKNHLCIPLYHSFGARIWT